MNRNGDSACIGRRIERPAREIDELREMVQDLARRVAALEDEIGRLRGDGPVTTLGDGA